ncbi:MalY/PatB family protein [Atlantibacter hermannii]|uniref:MalY/PatB family protein n=1 Tax=Atlantibacter hermannii TaxID=565 RepID=UPI0034D56B4A
MTNFDEIIQRDAGCRKTGQLNDMFGTTDLLPLWIADMDFATPPAITRTMMDIASEPVQGYFLDYPGWKHAVREWYDYRYQLCIEDEWLHFVPGVIKSIVFSILAMTELGDKVLTCTPVYDPYPNLVNTSRRTLVQTRLTERNGSFEFDWDDLENKLQGCKLFLFSSPHNPGGVVWDNATLSRIADLCAASGTLIISDEIHGDLTLLPAKHRPFFSISDNACRNVIVLTSASKTFNIPGVQGGVAIIPDKALRNRFYGFLDGCYLAETNIMQQAALSSAYTHCRDWHTDLLSYLADNIHYVKTEIASRCPDITVLHGGASYLLFLNAEKMALDDASLKSFFVHEARLGLSPGLQYGPGGERHMRLNVASPRAVLVEAMNRLATACQRVHTPSVTTE